MLPGGGGQGKAALVGSEVEGPCLLPACCASGMPPGKSAPQHAGLQPRLAWCWQLGTLCHGLLSGACPAQGWMCKVCLRAMPAKRSGQSSSTAGVAGCSF